MTAGTSPARVHAMVLYGSRFGNTDRIAHALSRGLDRTPGIEVECRSIGEISAKNLGGYDFLAFGAPTEMFSASKGMKEFLEGLTFGELNGKRGFAFDTRLSSRLSGSAGKYIEKHLEQLGVEIVRPHASATVRGMTAEERKAHGSEGAPDWVHRLEGGAAPPAPAADTSVDLLAAGSEAEFERIGGEIGQHLLHHS